MKKISNWFIPNEQVESIFEIDLDRLRGREIRNILLDIDNTLLPFGVDTPTLKCIRWIEDLKMRGFQVLIVSNSRSSHRVKRIANALDIKAVYYALKPLPWVWKEVAHRFLMDSSDTVMIGDQLFTDVILAKSNHLYSILVKPIRLDNKPGKAIQYELEQLVLRLLQ